MKHWLGQGPYRPRLECWFDGLTNTLLIIRNRDNDMENQYKIFSRRIIKCAMKTIILKKYKFNLA